MAKHKSKSDPSTSVMHTLGFNFRSRHIQVILDKVLLFQLMRRLHGRFWGVAGITIMGIGFAACYLIRPDLLRPSAAISDFADDVRTAPYFAGALFFAAYGLGRWRRYLLRTLKRPRPISWLTMLTIIGLVIVALTPTQWTEFVDDLHIFGLMLAGLSIAATVIADYLLSETQPNKRLNYWRSLRLLSFLFIVVGGYITFGSLEQVGWFNVTLLGEFMMLGGYTIWIYIKTYLGEGKRSQLSKLLKSIVFVD